MTDQTQAQLTLLAGAEDDQGNPIYPALRTLCDDGECDATGGFIQWTGEPYAKPGYTDLINHPDCEGNRYVPNPDPIVLIAACQKQGWVPSFPWNGYVSLHDFQTDKWICDPHGATTLAALVSVVFQATETLKPANWERCPWGLHQDGRCMRSPGVDMNHPREDCKGAGYILKEQPHAR